MSEESKELDGNVSTVELLGEVKTAIRKILIGGQSYQIGSRKLTRADLYQLRKLKEELEAEIAAEGDTSLLDNTYVAFLMGGDGLNELARQRRRMDQPGSGSKACGMACNVQRTA